MEIKLDQEASLAYFIYIKKYSSLLSSLNTTDGKFIKNLICITSSNNSCTPFTVDFVTEFIIITFEIIMKVCIWQQQFTMTYGHGSLCVTYFI